MSMNVFFDGLDNAGKVGKFFVDITERLGDGEIKAGEDVTRLSRILGIPIPSELADTSIIFSGNGEVTEPAKELFTKRTSPQIIISYPPVFNSNLGQEERKFKRCFKVCQTVAGGKICAEVCVEIDISLSGIGGEIKASVSVVF